VLGRQGGDEFTSLLKDINEAEVKGIANKIIQSFQQPIRVDGKSSQISTSFGIALYLDHGNDYLSLLRKADNGLYKAKENRNTFVMSNDFNE